MECLLNTTNIACIYYHISHVVSICTQRTGSSYNANEYQENCRCADIQMSLAHLITKKMSATKSQPIEVAF